MTKFKKKTVENVLHGFQRVYTNLVHLMECATDVPVVLTVNSIR